MTLAPTHLCLYSRLWHADIHSDWNCEVTIEPATYMYPCCVLKNLKFQYTLYTPRNPTVCFVHMAGPKLSGDLTTQELACICSTLFTHFFLCYAYSQVQKPSPPFQVAKVMQCFVWHCSLMPCLAWCDLTYFMQNTKVELAMHTLNLNWIDVTLAYFKRGFTYCLKLINVCFNTFLQPRR